MKITIENGSVSLAQSVANFAYALIGKKVGDGECATLASYVLSGLGCMTTDDYGISGPTADYQWGKLLHKFVGKFINFADIGPGCILQYRNVHYSKNDPTEKTKHHSVVVYERTPKAFVFKTLEQNVGPKLTPEVKKRIVQMKERDYSTMDGGTIWVYSPVPKKKK